VPKRKVPSSSWTRSGVGRPGLKNAGKGEDDKADSIDEDDEKEEGERLEKLTKPLHSMSRLR
jgi:hypothetical protein